MANNAELPTWPTTRSSTESGSNKIELAGGASSASGSRDDDAVVRVHALHVESESVANRRFDRVRPRRVDASTERRMDAHTPVPQLVAEPLDDDRAIVGHGSGRITLFLEVGEKIACRIVIQPRLGEPLQVTRLVPAVRARG